MHAIDPLTGKIAKSRNVLFSSEPARLEAAHLACRRRASRGRFPADDPTRRGIVAEPLGVVDILVSGQATEDNSKDLFQLVRRALGPLIGCVLACL
jgi:hypothetical protein